MLDVDTCVLLAVLTPEAHSATAAAFLAQASAPLAVSSWSVTELHSALGLQVLDLEPQDFRNANACLRDWSTTLRAADALHLAIASWMACQSSSDSSTALLRLPVICTGSWDCSTASIRASSRLRASVADTVVMTWPSPVGQTVLRNRWPQSGYPWSPALHWDSRRSSPCSP